MDDVSGIVTDSATRLFSSLCDRETLARAASGAWAEALWRAVAEAGLASAAVSEQHGGAGLSIDAALDLVRIAAEHSAPIPFGETVAGTWLLDSVGISVPAGPVTIAADGPAVVRATPTASGYRLEGRLNRVAYGRHVDACVVEFLVDHEVFVARLDRGDFSVEDGNNLAGEPRDSLTISVEISAERSGRMPPQLGGLRALGAVVRTCQLAGATARAGAESIEYAQQRVQFGKALSKFQAIQQMLAVFGDQIAVVAAAADMARHALGGPHSYLTAAVAKARASEAAGVAAGIAHQVHGAIGFTLEHALQFSTKRLWSWREEFGNEHEWNTVFGRHLLRAGSDRLWPEITLI